METSLWVPNDPEEPVLTFWTKYGAHARPWFHFPGLEFGWVQISTDGGRNWTSLAGQSSSTYVDPLREAYQLTGDDLGHPPLPATADSLRRMGGYLNAFRCR